MFSTAKVIITIRVQIHRSVPSLSEVCKGSKFVADCTHYTNHNDTYLHLIC